MRIPLFFRLALAASLFLVPGKAPDGFQGRLFFFAPRAIPAT
jgi:hypothetical protein